MKKLTLLIGVLLAVNVLAAQDNREKAKERISAKLEEYKERLELSDEQVAEVKAIREKYQPEMQAIKSDASMTRSDKMRAAADVLEKQEAEINEMLTPAQQEEWQVIRTEIKDAKEARKERRADRSDGGKD